MNVCQVAAAACLLGMTGCQVTSPDLEPLDVGDVEIRNKRAVVTDGAIEITVEYAEWPENVRITEEVTPIRIVVDNRGERSVTVRYDDFALLGTSGVAYRALPPFDIKGSAIVLGGPDSTLHNPAIEYRSFRVFQPYGPVYPGLDTFSGPYFYDAYYSDTYAQWPRRELPTEEMLARALPEGVIDPGGRLAGWLYFERVDDDEAWVIFEALLGDVETGEPVSRLNVTFLVRD